MLFYTNHYRHGGLMGREFVEKVEGRDIIVGVMDGEGVAG